MLFNCFHLLKLGQQPSSGRQWQSLAATLEAAASTSEATAAENNFMMDQEMEFKEWQLQGGRGTRGGGCYCNCAVYTARGKVEPACRGEPGEKNHGGGVKGGQPFCLLPRTSGIGRHGPGGLDSPCRCRISGEQWLRPEQEAFPYPLGSSSTSMVISLQREGSYGDFRVTNYA